MENWSTHDDYKKAVSIGVAVDVDEAGNIIVAGNFWVGNKPQGYVVLLNWAGSRLWEKAGQPGDESVWPRLGPKAEPDLPLRSARRERPRRVVGDLRGVGVAGGVAAGRAGEVHAGEASGAATGIRNKDLAVRFIEAMDRGDWPAVGTLLSPDVILHDEANTVHGVAGVLLRLQTIQELAPHAANTIAAVLAEGDLVAVRWTSPPGAIQFVRIHEDQVAEAWCHSPSLDRC